MIRQKLWISGQERSGKTKNKKDAAGFNGLRRFASYLSSFKSSATEPNTLEMVPTVTATTNRTIKIIVLKNANKNVESIIPSNQLCCSFNILLLYHRICCMKRLKNKKDDVIISSNDYYLIQNQVINIVGGITMTYKIIGDSCLDLPKELRNDPHFQMIPLTLQVGSASVVDDETFDQKQFLELVAACPECPKTACPSPERFKEAYECDADNIYVITLSEHLSGTYNAARLGMELYYEEHGHDKKILVMGSDSASAGQLNQALYIQELCEAGLSFEEISEKAEAFKNQMKTYFVLETLDILRKNGRLSGLQAFFATTLNIKPIMGGDKGHIVKLDQARGVNKALQRMCDIAAKEVGETSERTLVIAYCNNKARAELVKAEMEKRGAFKRVVITETAGVATVYAADGGIVMAL